MFYYCFISTASQKVSRCLFLFFFSICIYTPISERSFIYIFNCFFVVYCFISFSKTCFNILLSSIPACEHLDTWTCTYQSSIIMHFASHGSFDVFLISDSDKGFVSWSSPFTKQGHKGLAVLESLSILIVKGISANRLS